MFNGLFNASEAIRIAQIELTEGRYQQHLSQEKAKRRAEKQAEMFIRELRKRKRKYNHNHRTSIPGECEVISNDLLIEHKK